MPSAHEHQIPIDARLQASLSSIEELKRRATVAELTELIPEPFASMHPTKLGKLLVKANLDSKRSAQGVTYVITDVQRELSSIASSVRRNVEEVIEEIIEEEHQEDKT